MGKRVLKRLFLSYNQSMNKIEVAGLKIDAVTKPELLTLIHGCMSVNKKSWITTVYSEFLYAALENPKIMEMLNKADFAVADGIGVFWARRYLEIPLTAKSYWGKILQALWQIKYSLAAIVFNPQWIKSLDARPSYAEASEGSRYKENKSWEKIVGADLIWDLAKLAADNNLSIYLLGGFENTPELVKQKLISQYPNISISTSNKNPNDPAIIEDIKKSSADMLFVAYGPIKQEKWIAENLPKLNIKLAIGVGGTFDYIAGKKSAPPKFIRYSGLEWLWRLVMQPYRFKRIINATFGLILALWRYKIFMSYPYRPNIVSIILNKENKILICQRNPNNPEDKKFGFKKKDMANYWQFPQGGIDKGESIEQTALRECKEELGITNLSIFKISQKKHSYLYPNALRPLFRHQSKYKGQEQFIAYLKFMGTDSEIRVDNIEFIKHKWIEPEKLGEVHEHRKNVAKIAQEDLKEMI